MFETQCHDLSQNMLQPTIKAIKGKTRLSDAHLKMIRQALILHICTNLYQYNYFAEYFCLILRIRVDC